MVQVKHIAGYPGLVYWYRQVGSTNDVARQLGQDGAPGWSVVVAEAQTSGRGRYRRRWESPAGMGLWFSLLLRLDIPLPRINLVNLTTTLLLADFLERLLQEQGIHHTVAVKWPNDLLIRQRKLCGILLESHLQHQQLQHLVLGVGLNLNQQEADFPPELQNRAISLRQISGRTWAPEAVLEQFLPDFYRRFTELEERNFAGVVAQYRQRMIGRGDYWVVALPHKRLKGKLKDIDENGFLIMENGQGEHLISAGDLWEMSDGQENENRER